MLGYTNIRVFHDGMPAWKKAGKPLFSNAKSLQSNMETETPVVLIDVRDVESAKAAHIKGAVSVPADMLASAKDKFPSNKKAPVIIYGADTEAGMKAFSTVRGWGFKDTTVLMGGIAGWQKAGLPVETGAAASEIVYVPKPKPGALSINDFTLVADHKKGDAVILDVRSDDETDEGTIKGAIAIPAEEVSARLAEIPKDKIIFVHCSTGIRAEMAYLTLKEEGYKAGYLDANIKVAKGGEYTITEKE